jgi:hypothetical protein
MIQARFPKQTTSQRWFWDFLLGNAIGFGGALGESLTADPNADVSAISSL